MGRGGKGSSKRNINKKVRSKNKCSDDSDEDYVVSDDGNDVSDEELEDYCFPLDGCGSEEGFGSFVDEEEEEEKEVIKVVKPKSRNGNRGNGKTRKRKRVSDDDEEDDEDYEEEDGDEDEEFTPDEDDCLDEEEDLVVIKKKKNVRKTNNKKLGRKGSRKKASVKIRKRSKSMVSKKPKKARRIHGLRRKKRCDDDDDDDGDFVDTIPVAREKSKTNSSRRNRKHTVGSDSDFVSSGSADYDYTISEEEREQVREAHRLCGSFETSLRSSSSSQKIQEDDNFVPQRKPPAGRKGKEKIEEEKSKVGKQVCGICLSEEDKRRSRGTLNCCSHYFCFTCIMEWSKVESRCPLCKQRFKTITKPERSTAAVDLRSVTIQVPKRDQVYQPSEEDLRSFLDPYENVICSECHQGGDDGLMLLCDVCDSSAHTYCVGLGRIVPEGNWYCDGCRPAALGSSSLHAQDPLPNDQQITSNISYNRPSPIVRPSPVVSFGEGNPSSVSSPRIVPSTQGLGNLSSPRFIVGDAQGASSPGSGAGAPTLTGRRLLQRHIHTLFSNRTNNMAGSADGLSATNSNSDFFNSQVDQGRETAVQPARTPDTVPLTLPLHQTILEERLHGNPSSSVGNGDVFASRLNQLRRQGVHDPTVFTNNGPVNLTLWPELPVINSIPAYEQLRQRGSISNSMPNGCVPPFTAMDEGVDDFNIAKEQLQSIIKGHLHKLSRDFKLDYSTFKDIARSSTHTILAACGLEHRWCEVHIVPPPPMCSHAERVAAGRTSLMKGFCSSCFDSFVKDVVKTIMDTRLPQWLSLGL